MKKLLTFIVVLGVIGTIVVGGMKVIKAKRAAELKTPKPITYAIHVKTLSPVQEKSILTLPYLALTKSNDDVKISSRVNARIKYIVTSGTVVKKGDLIAKLDDKELKTQIESLNLNISSLKSQLKSKEIALKNLENTHKRTQKLLSVRGASQEEFEREVTNLETLKSGIDTLKFKIKELAANKASVENMRSYTKILSPINGAVTKLVNVGDVAMMGKPIISISARSNSYLLVSLPASIHAKEIIYNKKKFSLSPLNTTKNGLLEYLANIDESLASEQTINIDVVIFDGKGFKLPHDAILNRNGKNYVLVLKNDLAKAKKIKIVANGEQGVIVDGVNKDEKIIVAKQDILLRLLGGIKVKAVR
ncbi:MAG: biotin/lipoyl-binding protein [Sulfurospirillaceae bacterium]|nr:biotin/lipoyl-binding protein [Sulfurospirillaceae bacterium]